ncbi:flagellar export chaperone FlgN [Aeoliella sp. SH292]|uniref:flagellar export chaperone FlgN n=1 Tax=Aeoliella sp. SH292 TaxID=3454464 RepID=UPI003F9E45DA
MTTQLEHEPTATEDWEPRISGLLSTLSAVQGDLLALLGEKRQALAAGEFQLMPSFTAREAELVARLEACHAQRQDLLVAAAREGLPSTSVASLAESLPSEQRGTLSTSVEQARRQSRLLQHHSLTNWVVVQRTLIHLSQMIEIIATGGRMRNTYGRGAQATSSGALVDQRA